MQNLKIAQFIETVKQACAESIAEGVPPYAISLALEHIQKNDVANILNAEMKKEYAQLQEESRKAVPSKEGPVTKDLQEE